MRPAIVGAAAVALGLLVHVELRLGAQAAETAALRQEIAALPVKVAEATPPAPAGAPSFVMRASMNADEVRAIAQAVVELEGRTSAAAVAAAHPDAASPRSLDQEKALARATERATAAVGRGHLSRDDILQMRSDLAAAGASAEEIEALRSQIAVAINTQKLRPDDPRFVFP